MAGNNRTNAPDFGLAQMALPLGWAAQEAADKFLIAECNRTAFDLIAGADEWRNSGAILIGPSRSGKTKLGRHVAKQGRAMLIDDADGMPDEDLFHQWNRARDAGLAPLLTAATLPGEWGVTLPDLQSRLGGAVVASIAEPDEAFLAALIRYHLGLLGGSIAEDALSYAIPRLPRTHAMADHFAAEANALALAQRRAITLPLVRDLLTRWEASAQMRFDDDL